MMCAIIWSTQIAKAQTDDTTKNKIEIKKKVRKGSHGRTVTKIKMSGQGTASAINGAADGAVTGHLPTPPTPAPVVVTPPPPEPKVVVVHDTVRTPAPAPAAVVIPAPVPAPTTTTQVTTTTETKPAVTASTHVTNTSTHKKPVHVYHRGYKRTKVAGASTKTTTTTTVKKTE